MAFTGTFDFHGEKRKRCSFPKVPVPVRLNRNQKCRVPGAGMRCRVPVPVPVRFCQKVPGANRHPAPEMSGADRQPAPAILGMVTIGFYIVSKKDF